MVLCTSLVRLNRLQSAYRRLTPFVVQNRFVSLGRHFTHRELLTLMAERLSRFLKDGDVLVDVSAGRNELVDLIVRRQPTGVCVWSGLNQLTQSLLST